MKGRMIRGLYVVMCCLMLAACAGGKEPDNKAVSKQEDGTQTADIDYAYVPEFYDIRLYEGIEGERYFLSREQLSEQGMVYAINSYQEGRELYLMQREWSEGVSAKVLPIEFEEALGEPVVDALLYDEKGNLYLYWSDLRETGDVSFLSKYDKDYKLVYEKAMEDVWVDAQNISIVMMAADKEGRLYALSNNLIYVFDDNGALKRTIDLGNVSVENIFCDAEGRILVAYYNKSLLALARIDLKTHSLEEVCKNLPQRSSQVWSGQGGKLFVKTQEMLYEYDVEKEEATQLLKWSEVNISGDTVQFVRAGENGKIIILCRNYHEEKIFFPERELVFLSKVERDKIPVKEILTLATIGTPNAYLTSAVAKFNKRNSEYCIEFKSYTDRDILDAVNRFHADLVSGNGADIYDLYSMDWENMVQKGALEDLTPYLLKSAEIGKDSFVPAVVNAYERDGRLYTLPRRFEVHALIGKASIVGTEAGWTIEEMKQLSEGYPKAVPVHGSDGLGLLAMCVEKSPDIFVDYEAGTCDFDSMEFIEFLEFAKEAGENFKGSFDICNDVEKNNALLADVSISNLDQYQCYRRIFGGEGNYIGYPTADGSTRAVIKGWEMLAISSVSTHKETAWEFVEAFLQKEESLLSMFPSLKISFEKMLEADMEVEYMEDAQGNVVPKPLVTSHNGVEVQFHEATKEDRDCFLELLSCTKTQNADEEIRHIVITEAKAFFDDMKTASEVADIIQRRVQLYLQEQQ